MTDADREYMKLAIEWANGCSPKTSSIPKVGAIIVAGGNVIGRGRRGTGIEGDDHHAERTALKDVDDKASLANATLFTTLEPCTRDVRSVPLECCTELIIQHRIKKVFVGNLDPNQGVTGKGILRLQEAGVDVELFPHELTQQLRAINAPFIRTQQGLGATIISPADGEVIPNPSGNEITRQVRFKCLNPPTDNNFLLCFFNGLCWPQIHTPRECGQDEWEMEAGFGPRGQHVLHLVTATDLGKVLMMFCNKVYQENRERHQRVSKALSQDQLNLLGNSYPGISMIGLPKGLRSEASVTVNVVPT